jgi:hypothetical protein
MTFFNGHHLMKYENKKIEAVADTAAPYFMGGEYYIAKCASNANQTWIYHSKTGVLQSEDFNISDTISAYRTSKNLYVIKGDKKLHRIIDGKSDKSVALSFDDAAFIVGVDESHIFVATSIKREDKSHNTQFVVIDQDLVIQASAPWRVKGVEHLSIESCGMLRSRENNFLVLINLKKGHKPVIMKKVGDAKFVQAKVKEPEHLGVVQFEDMQIRKNSIILGTGRKVFELFLTEKNFASLETKPSAKNIKESSSNLKLETLYKDLLFRVKRGEIKTNEVNKNNTLTCLRAGDTSDQLFYSKNNENNSTSICRYTFSTATETTILSEVAKVEHNAYLVDFVFNKENKIFALDDFGTLYFENEKGALEPAPIMTSSRNSKFNSTRTRQIVLNSQATKGYILTDDTENIVEFDLVKGTPYRVLRGELNGTLGFAVVGDGIIVGVRQVWTLSGYRFNIYRYDLLIQKTLEEFNLNHPANYSFEAFRSVSDKNFAVFFNRKVAGSPDKGTSSDVLYTLYNSNLEQVFSSPDTPLGNKFGVTNIFETTPVYQDLPLLFTSREAKIYVHAIEDEFKLKLLDTLIFSEGDSSDSTYFLTQAPSTASARPPERRAPTT